MRKQVAKGDRTYGRDSHVERTLRIDEDAHMCNLRRHAADGLVEPEAPRVEHGQGGDGRDGFGQRRNSVERVARGGQLALDVASPDGQAIERLAWPPDQRDESRQLATRGVLVQGALERRDRWPRHPANIAGWNVCLESVATSCGPRTP